ncbi:hypothetical protein RN001_015060 [Aquatica leii]|uniref:Uncharacterized protein n=1 Tax=Aquatica leii TaxID=1421715 RepID=A0AAN7S6H4_9COLE|nr:hypothetical protein RN001_015060 [Aquatica leii]
MAEEYQIPVPNASIQNNGLEEETNLLIPYGQTKLVRCTWISILLLLFFVGLITGLYLLFTEGNNPYYYTHLWLSV